MSTEQTKNGQEWDKRELGAFWTRVSSKGSKFLTGKLTVDGKVIEAVAFPRKPDGPDDNKPTLKIYESTPRESWEPEAANTKATKKEAGAKAAPKQEEEEVNF